MMPRVLSVGAVGLLFVGLLTVGEARAGAIQCGATLGPGGTFVLDADLTCPHDPSPAAQPALRVVDAVLDLNGHTLSCADGGDGITLVGEGGRLRPIRGFYVPYALRRRLSCS